MKNEKSFRKNLVGGFNTRDVVEYLAQMARERREETEALRVGAEKLRKERDAALGAQTSVPPEADEERLTWDEERTRWQEERARWDAERTEWERERARWQEEKAALDAERQRIEAEKLGLEEGIARLGVPSRAAEDEAESLRRQLSALIEEKNELLMQREDWESRREAVPDPGPAQERDALLEEREGWLQKEASLIRERDALLVSAARAGDEKAGFEAMILELNTQAAAQTEQIAELRRQIIENGLQAELLEKQRQEESERAEALEKAAGQIVTDTRQGFNDVMAFGRSAALSVVLEMDKMRDYFARFADVFAATEESLSQLETGRKHLVRAFVPSEFFEPAQPHETKESDQKEEEPFG